VLELSVLKEPVIGYSSAVEEEKQMENYQETW
jgi:hypothetical protein